MTVSPSRTNPKERIEVKALTGVLLVNLGTPDSAGTYDVLKYLREFLMDNRVIDISAFGRWLLVNLVIVPFRASKSSKVYKKISTKTGLPLKVFGEANARTLQERLGEAYSVKLAMRYQNPNIEDILEEFRLNGVQKLIILPLFPQYASATTGSIFQKTLVQMSDWQIMPELKIFNQFYKHPDFIKALVANARPMIAKSDYEHYVFSYHGLPERQIYKSSTNAACTLGECCSEIKATNALCYRAQCFDTTRLLVEALGIPKGKYTTCFQSRLGKAEWIKPYSEDIIKDLASKGIQKILAFSPAFVADCLETTIEVGEEYRDLFLGSGGQQWDLVPSLNNSEHWLDFLEGFVKNK